MKMIFNKDSRQQSQRSHVRKLGGGAALMIFTVLVLLNTVSVSAQKTHFDRSSEVIIHVKDSDGIPISGAVVKNLNDGTEKITNENGTVHFTGGLKAITIAATNFDSIQIKQIDLQDIEVILFPRQIAETVYVRSTSMAGSDGALEDMPGAVSRLDQSDLTKTAVVDFGGALRKVPSVHVKDEEGLGLRPNIGIRGSNPTRSTKVLLLEDGLPLTYAPYGDNASYYHPPIERFEAIEVVKGSGQIEYGPVTVVGVINYMTPNPTDNFEGTFKLSSGTRDYLMGDALLTGRLGAFGFVGSVNRKQGEGARMNTRTGLTDSLFKLTRNIGSRGYVAIKATALRERSQVTYSGLTEDEFRIDPRGNPFINDRFYGDREGISSALSLAPTPRTSLSANIYLNRFSRDWWRQSSNSAQRPNRLGVDADCLGMADLLTHCGNEGRLRDYLNYGFEPLLTHQFTLSRSRIELRSGFRLHGERQVRVQKNGDLPTSRDGFLVEDDRRRTSAASTFLSGKAVMGRVAMHLGTRIERITNHRRNLLTNTMGRADLLELIPGGGLTFNPSTNTTVFFGFHKGFAPPRTEDVISGSGGVVDLEPERSTNLELGFRAKLGSNLNLDATAFSTDYRNQTVPATIAGGTGTSVTNGGRTLHRGVEFAAKADSAGLIKGKNVFTLNISVTGLLKAHYTGERYSLLVPSSRISVTGRRLPYAPKATLNTSLSFNRGSFGAVLENNFISSQFSDDLNTTAPSPNGQRGLIPRQSTLSLTTSYRIEKHRTTIFLSVKNLMNDVFIVDRSRGILPSSPRTIQTGIRFSL